MPSSYCAPHPFRYITLQRDDPELTSLAERMMLPGPGGADTSHGTDTEPVVGLLFTEVQVC